jgi:ribosomal protein L11 methyltransferase
MAWKRVDVVVDGAEADALCEALESGGALSTEISDADIGTPREQAVFGEPGADPAYWPRTLVSALFSAAVDAERIVAQALAASAVAPLEPASVKRVESADWVALTQQQFTPIRVGQRLWVVPTWYAPPDPGAINIVLDPGAAFGTGTHPSTRLCMEWLERNVSAGDTVLDYGCGSGILAIAALKLGARSATATDIDPLALEAARYNSRQNDVVLEVVDAEGAIAGAARVTVANILANPLRMLAPIIAAHTVPGGKIALSGILEEQADEVRAAYAPWADLEVAARDEGWVLLAGTRER